MKRAGTKSRRAPSARTVISLALTWDGARWPIRALPPEARAFLGTVPALPANGVTELLRDDRVKELRICWVPRLKGGPGVLSEPFSTATGRRLNFKAIRSVQFDDVLGVVYQR